MNHGPKRNWYGVFFLSWIDSDSDCHCQFTTLCLLLFSNLNVYVLFYFFLLISQFSSDSDSFFSFLGTSTEDFIDSSLIYSNLSKI